MLPLASYLPDFRGSTAVGPTSVRVYPYVRRPSLSPLPSYPLLGLPAVAAQLFWHPRSDARLLGQLTHQAFA